MHQLGVFVCFFIAQIASIEATTSNSIANGGFTSIDCLYARRVVSYGKRLENEKSTDLCITADNEQGLKLPDGFIDNTQSIISGQSFVRIHGARINRDRRHKYAGWIAVQDNATVELLRSGRARIGEPITIGTRIVLTIRVTALDGQVFLDRTTLGNYLFADDGINLKNVYESCSFGKLNIVPYQGPGVVNGVAEFFYNQTVKGMNSLFIEYDLVDSIRQLYGKEFVDYHNLFIMLPPGTQHDGLDHWCAYADYGLYKAVFSNNCAGSVSAHAHEFGHNLNLWHSAKDGDEYGDRTGYMGYSYYSIGSPAMCFNGHKNSELGWYWDRMLVITPPSLPWTGNLVTFVDYDKSYDNETVLIQINDLFFQYNRAKKFNSGTGQSRNEITITQAASRFSVSNAIATLSLSTKNYTILNYTDSESLVVEVCSAQRVSSNGRADLYRMSIHLESKASGCTDVQPTSRPVWTKAPALSPPSPTQNPARRRKPSQQPNDASVTAKPTIVASIPTATPTDKPTVITPKPTSTSTLKPTSLKSRNSRKPTKRRNNSPPPSRRPTVITGTTQLPSPESPDLCFDHAGSFQYHGQTRDCHWLSLQSDLDFDRFILCNAIGPTAWQLCLQSCHACL